MKKITEITQIGPLKDSTNLETKLETLAAANKTVLELALELSVASRIKE
jgi:hypothetical protein